MTPPADAQNIIRDQAIPTISLKDPIATDAILAGITDEPQLERVNRYIYAIGIVSMLIICSISVGLYFVSR